MHKSNWLEGLLWAASTSALPMAMAALMLINVRRFVSHRVGVMPQFFCAASTARSSRRPSSLSSMWPHFSIAHGKQFCRRWFIAVRSARHALLHCCARSSGNNVQDVPFGGVPDSDVQQMIWGNGVAKQPDVQDGLNPNLAATQAGLLEAYLGDNLLGRLAGIAPSMR
ncbi:unnamed protein product [Prorocentrum cordatum]|uniref:Uncharacterized protein n=1 Tax=Prorocentrum cordatum TaxID=2364126 RepID=A0ABN9TBV0_9DINO|nr:unnamed protein product [Polarella glacialis]